MAPACEQLSILGDVPGGDSIPTWLTVNAGNQRIFALVFSTACSAANSGAPGTGKSHLFSTAYSAANALMQQVIATVIFSAAYSAANVMCWSSAAVQPFSAAYSAANVAPNTLVQR